ncbi:hypothetical protein ACFO26_07830 [Lactococcus nasutitermitis]|uniref:CAP-associated domain-containing protein n=1 Tax=Lactococcus nasutitermitis TaxID=1652957 RepID=A0ABV9JE74_9LACT|nr:hypothetical protein [Lactococcus nasutitermitis]
MKKRSIGIIAAVFIVIFAFSGYFYFKKQEVTLAKNLSSNQVPKWTASTSPLMNQKDWENKVLHHHIKKGTTVKDAVIPGLRGAWSINPKTGKAAYASKWTPQGITQTDKYTLISAYDGNHQLDSLIFVLNKKTERYVKSLIIPAVSHLGGLAYDPVRKNIWLSNDTNIARLSVLKERTIDNYNAKISKQAIKIDENFKLPWIKATSTIALSDNALEIPYFSASQTSSVVTIPLVNGKIELNRLPKKKINTSSTGKMLADFKKSGALNYIFISPAFKKMQGLALYQTAAIFTSSFGNKNSTVTFANVKKTANLANTATFNYKFNKLGSLSVLPYLEQVSINQKDKSLSMLFESGSMKYRGKTPYVMDRLLIMPVNLKNLSAVAAQ